MKERDEDRSKAKGRKEKVGEDKINRPAIIYLWQNGLKKRKVLDLV
jgi:hypothetical protein